MSSLHQVEGGVLVVRRLEAPINKESLSGVVYITQDRADITSGWHVVSTVQGFVKEACCVL